MEYCAKCDKEVTDGNVTEIAIHFNGEQYKFILHNKCFLQEHGADYAEWIMTPEQLQEWLSKPVGE